MPKVEIDTPGVTIRLEAGEASLAELSKTAMDLYREASTIDSKRAPQMGFASQQTERRGTWDHVDYNTVGSFSPVNAKATP